MKKFIFCLAFLLSSCAITQPTKIPMEIDLVTVDKNNQPVDAVCSINSSSTKLETLSPNKVTFITECSSINVLCKAGKLTGEEGLVNDDGLTTDNFIFNISSSSTSNSLLGKGLNLSDLIAKSCAVSGSILNKKGLKIENII